MTASRSDEPKARLFFALDPPDATRELLAGWQDTELTDPALRPVQFTHPVHEATQVHHDAGADDLTGIPDASVDVVTTRSVLIYVARKEAAFAEFLSSIKFKPAAP